MNQRNLSAIDEHPVIDGRSVIMDVAVESRNPEVQATAQINQILFPPE